MAQPIIVRLYGDAVNSFFSFFAKGHSMSLTPQVQTSFISRSHTTGFLEDMQALGSLRILMPRVF
jgi:hypothetical protein